MHKIYYFVLIFAYIGICIDCQGGGGRHKSSSTKHYSHSYHHSHSHSYSHSHGGGGGGGNIIIGVAIVFGILIIIAVIWVLYDYCTEEGEPDESNSEFVSKNSRQIQQDTNVICIENKPVESVAGFAYSTNTQQIVGDTNLFHSGIWSSDYKQYDQWHGPFEMSLTFNPDSQQVTGSGSDDVGLYFITGTYSHQTRRIALTKTYHAGTGNMSQNLGHNVTIQLTHTHNSQFEGKWYVRTSEYSGEDDFVLKRKPEQGHRNNYYSTARPEIGFIYNMDTKTI